MSDRREGWYWVKKGNEWIPSKLSKSGHPDILDRGRTYELGSRIPSPDEAWQCVPKDPTSEMYLAGSKGFHWGSMNLDDVFKGMLSAAPSPDDQ